MAPTARSALLSAIATTIADYRQGEIPAPTPQHVDRWVQQFDPAVQDDVLAEMKAVLDRVYVSRAEVEDFLAKLIPNQALTGGDAARFWRSAHLLSIQQQGSSQADMLALMDGLLKKQLGFGVAACGAAGGPYVYLDDVLYTGTRIRTSLSGWIANTAPNGAVVHVIVIGWHTSGWWYTKSELNKIAAPKGITINWWKAAEFEDRLSEINNADVLRPMMIPAAPLAQAYAQELAARNHPAVLRKLGGASKMFSSEANRNTLEQTFLLSGLWIRSQYANPKRIIRPLGFMLLDTLGFGTLIVTYRNCANNCPLALWWGDPTLPRSHPFNKWYPLFPRKGPAGV